MFCFIPYLQFGLMMYFSSFSRFFVGGPFYFIAMNGLFLTYVTGHFNLNSTAGMKFDWFYVWPLIYFTLLALDSFGVFDDKVCMIMYRVYTIMLLKNYLAFMRSVVEQLTSYLSISFLKVKPVKAKTK